MRLRVLGLLTCLVLPCAALADDQVPSTDIFSYSTLELDHLHQHSDFFADSSQGNGLRAAWDFDGGVYVFGQWAKLDFDRVGSHTVQGIGVGAHQAYSSTMSFYIDLAFMQDKLSADLGAATDDYWRIDYGMRAQVTTMIELDAAIFAERNTQFGGRPFGLRAGGGLDFGPVSVLAGIEHTANGNTTLLNLIWAYR
ncbi:MAG TPA: hypothetical protein VGM16_08335 [Gammaproteobacteria bacterium]|jgi:hypothetical protein